MNGTKTIWTGHFNENAWQLDEVSTDTNGKLINATRTLEFFQNGLAKVEQFRDDKTGIIDNKSNIYFRKDSWGLCVVTGTRTGPTGTGVASTAQYLNDSNGVLSGKIGSQDECYGSTPPAVCIDTLPQGWLMNKQCILNSGNRQTNYFHSITGELLGGYTTGYMDILSPPLIPKAGILKLTLQPQLSYLNNTLKRPSVPDNGFIFLNQGKQIMYYLNKNILLDASGQPICVGSRLTIDEFNALFAAPTTLNMGVFLAGGCSDELYYRILNQSFEIIGISEAYLAQQYHAAFHNSGIGQDIKPFVGELNLYSQIHPVARIYPTDPAGKNNPLDWDEPQLMSRLGLQTYVVRPGDTFKSIAKKLSGDSHDALKIARSNGFATHHSSLKPGLQLRIPQFIASRNNTKTSRPDEDFLRVIGGVLSPILTMPNPPPAPPKPKRRKNKHGGFFGDVMNGFEGTVLKVVAVTIVCIAAPELAPLALAAIGAYGTIALALTTAAIAALGDAAIQGVCMEFTGQAFSFTEVLETAVTAGMSSGGVLQPLDGSLEITAKNAMKIGTAAVATQIAEMATGLRSKFDPGAIATQVTSYVLATKINEGIDGLFEKNPDVADVTKTIANPFTNAVVGKAVTNTPMDIKSFAANAMGSVIGTPLGEQTATLIPTPPTPPAPPTLPAVDIPNIDIDVNDPRWSADLKDLASRQRQARSLQSEATKNTHSYLLDADKRAQYKSTFFGCRFSQLEAPKNIGTRIMGGVQAIGGLAEAAAGIGVGLVTFETGIGVALGATAIVNGIDNYRSGFNTAFSGKVQPTIFEETVAPVLGMSPQVAQGIEMGIALGAGGADFVAVGLSRVGMFRAGGESVVNIATKAVNPRVEKMVQVIEDFLGKDYKFIKNKKGDPIFINQNNTKRIRFDSAYSHGDAPHGHVEILKDNDWVDYTDQHRIYLSPEPEPNLLPKNKL